MPVQTTLAYLTGVSMIDFMAIGIVAGLLLDVWLRGKGYGFLGNSLIGITGAIVGGFFWEKALKQYIKIDIGTAKIQLSMVLVALLGALLLLLLVNTVMRKRRD